MSHRNLNTLKVQRHCHVWTKEDKRGIIIKEERKGKQIKKIWSNINKVDQIFQMSPIYLFFSFHLSCFFFLSIVYKSQPIKSHKIIHSGYSSMVSYA